MVRRQVISFTVFVYNAFAWLLALLQLAIDKAPTISDSAPVTFGYQGIFIEYVKSILGIRKFSRTIMKEEALVGQ